MAQWYTISFRGTDTGLTPSFVLWQKLADAAAPTNPAPAIIEVGYGLYRFLYTPAEDVVFVVDGGATLPTADRYVRGVISPVDSHLDTPVSTRATPTDVRPFVTFLGGGEMGKPTIQSVVATLRTQVQVYFSEPVKMTADPDGALTLANYTIPGLELIAVTQRSLTQVELTTSVQAPGQPYSLTIQNIVDLNGNAI